MIKNIRRGSACFCVSAALALFLSTPARGQAPPCPADVNGDGVVNIDGLMAVINAWGPCPSPPAACPADITGDGVVNIDDLLFLLRRWGPCNLLYGACCLGDVCEIMTGADCFKN